MSCTLTILIRRNLQMKCCSAHCNKPDTPYPKVQTIDQLTCHSFHPKHPSSKRNKEETERNK
ncbi:hypothetical protein ASPBRDRAFT_466005 [Aspergillus brasiliensis CBS 101740]|uniref:Uncharacterized protein n=1 Tax=Aspergillus brasiliensis (strain CBS 101740 / IMI 381727 / IBT 21946) TaxID=767769 RepID=A0A1L9UTJ7_ASPBC|nr:hypothetical protein ASPBRDRAFT_466005 [Aspergillus brasiliensis CBS 101740]